MEVWIAILEVVSQDLQDHEVVRVDWFSSKAPGNALGWDRRLRFGYIVYGDIIFQGSKVDIEVGPVVLEKKT